MVVAKGTDVAALDQEADKLLELSRAAQADAQRVTSSPLSLRTPNMKTLRELKAGAERFMTHLDGAQTLKGESPARPEAEWLAEDGRQIRQEIDTVLDRLAADLGGILFR